MRVFVYEYLTATGTGRDPASPDHGIFREGRAMRDAVAADFARIPGVQVTSAEDEAFRRATREAEFALVIAPEFDGILEARARWAAEEGALLLGPSPEAIHFTADKAALADHWRECDIPTPATSTREPTACEAFPVVWKPRDGCGSTATFLLRNTFDLASARAKRAAEGHTGPMILQEFVPGVAASVALLVGVAGIFPLVPCLQRLSDDGRFQYLGGELPIAPALADRAVNLAMRAVECVPGLRGYVGVDLVLGESRDWAIEINPRLTTSYVGLRELATFNIAEAMLRVASGQHPGPMPWHAGPVRFAASGT